LAGKVIPKMTSINSLSISGYDSAPVPNTFFKQEVKTEHAAIILPGLGYSAHMPLLFYSRELMLSLRADVLTVEYEYNSRNFLALDGRERMKMLFADVQSAYDALLAQRKYKRITFIGKSLGTRAMAHLLTAGPLSVHVDAVWLTPLLKDAGLIERMEQFKGRSLFISGTADPHYDPDSMKEVKEATRGHMLLVDEGDHGLNIEGDIIRSIKELEKVINCIKSFISE
jgi:pimeloyl-ACP methyl ester carboxylesterase